MSFLNCTICGLQILRTSNHQKYCKLCKRQERNRRKREARYTRGQRIPNGPFNQPDEKASTWKGGGTVWQRRKFLKTKCSRCGSQDRLELHHKDRNRKNWEKDNLETLCLNCHHAEHKGEK